MEISSGVVVVAFRMCHSD